MDDELFAVDESAYLEQYGVLRRSGRYPYGSGKDGAAPYPWSQGSTQSSRNRMFLDYVAEMRAKGISDTDIARGVGITTSQLRAANSIARNQQKQQQISQAERLKARGLSNVAIGERMQINESSVRALLAPGALDKVAILDATASMLKDQVASKQYIDIGTGAEHQLGISDTKMRNAVAKLKEEGYQVHSVQVDQLGTQNKTTIKVLAPPGTEYRDIAANKDKIRQITDFSEDGGRSFSSILPPLSVSPKRVGIVYKEDGGDEADGVIYVRPGTKDLSMGSARYAQVRIKVGDDHYLKGMAMYKDDLPAGVDLQFNTNKSKQDPKVLAKGKLGAMKEVANDPENPFGAIVRQIGDHDPVTGKLTKVTSALNLVNEEGDWERWKKSVSSQMLSKQSPTLAKTQLDMTYQRKRQELDEIKALTNPAVRKKLLESYADDADSSAVHLKAAALPRQGSHVILPIRSMKETEVYAPNYRNGERVVLIRYPHGGVFEIPELTVNNNHREAKAALGQARDAIGINPKVAAKLSGADFDGDTVLVIPNNGGRVKTAPSLEGLKKFDPQKDYPGYEGMPVMSSRTKGIEMGKVSNLITDMTIQRASNDELARAVRHSMVVIDAEKHKLNYRLSAEVNGIPALMKKYQTSAQGGASTLVSRASAPIDVPKRRAKSSKDDPNVSRGVNLTTGEKEYVYTGESYVNRNGKTVVVSRPSKRLAETSDARTLLSKDGGTVIEKVYADHSNRLKALANEARLTAVKSKPRALSDSAKKTYAPEVKTLVAKLNKAVANRPLERQAQVFANTQVSAKRAANPGMDQAELKKVKKLALDSARSRTGAKKQQIEITPREWDAIQAGAITNNRLEQILANTDLDKVKALATPRTPKLMTSIKIQRAEQMANLGYTQAEIADALGVSLTTLKTELKI